MNPRTAGARDDPVGIGPADPPGRGPDPRRRVPFWAAALLLAITAGVLLVVALLAGRAGPLVAHPPTHTPRVPPPVTPPTMPTLPRPTVTPTAGASEPSGAWLWWVAVVLGGLVLLFVVFWLIRALRRPARIAAPAAAAVPAATVPAGLGALDEPAEADATDERSFDPHRAADDIIATWSAVEAAAGRIGHHRQAASTPTEFLAELTERFGDPGLPIAAGGAGGAHQVGDDVLGPTPIGGWTASTVLLRLYHHARFDTMALVPGAATVARSAARTMLARWGLSRGAPPSTADPAVDPADRPADRRGPGAHE